MSWDIFVQDLPANAKTIEDIPHDFRPGLIGKRSAIIQKIQEVVPTADFSDPSWGQVRDDDCSIEVSMGKEEDCDGFCLHVRGGVAAVGIVAAILQHLELRALDPTQDDGFFSAGPEAIEAFRKWKAYRNQVVNVSASNDPGVAGGPR